MRFATSRHIRRFLSATLAVLVTAIVITPASAVINAVGVEAQFIRINKTTPGDDIQSFHIGEVRALTLGTDYAVIGLGASATTTHGGVQHGNDAALISGVVNTGGDTWSRTDVNTGGMFETEALINLGQVRNLQEVQIIQRGDGCCADRLKDFTVTLEDATNTPVATSPLFAGTAPFSTSFVVGTGSEILPGDNGVIGTETVGSGRFVQVINNGNANRPLHIGELEVFADGVAPGPNGNVGGGNTPLNNPNDLATTSAGASIVSASTQGGHGVPGAVIDGLEQTAGTTWTKQQVGGGSQITVDLGGTFDVGTVRVHQRNDGCCQERLQNFSVNVFADDGAGGVGMLLETVSFPGQPGNNSFGQLSLSSPAFTIGSNDILKIELDPNAMTADLLQVGVLGNGALTIDSGAMLDLTLLNFDIPIATSQTFDILDFGSVTGTFAAITTNLTRAFRLDSTNLLVDGTVTVSNVLPEPTTAMLALLGVAGLAGRRRRQVA